MTAIAYVPVFEDLTAPHQIMLLMTRMRIGVSCTCLRTQRSGATGGRARGIIETRDVFPAAEAIAAWRGWHESEGITL